MFPSVLQKVTLLTDVLFIKSLYCNILSAKLQKYPSVSLLMKYGRSPLSKWGSFIFLLPHFGFFQ